MSTLNTEQEQKIAEFIKDRCLASGLGTNQSPCSIAAVNLALTGALTDKIPDCMSEVIGTWIIRVQDCMTPRMRNSKKWKALLPLAAGTGRDEVLEFKRIDIIMDCCWNALKHYQSFADKNGFGDEWIAMLDNRDCGSTNNVFASFENIENKITDEIFFLLINLKRYLVCRQGSKEFPLSTNAYCTSLVAESIYLIDENWKGFQPADVLKKLIEA
jgi:hypothetical protein